MRQLADRLPISRPAVSRHLRLLKDAGLVVDRPSGTRRIYRLHDAGVEAVRTYLATVWGEAAARFRLVAENTLRPPTPSRRPTRGTREAAGGDGVIEPLRLSFEVRCPAGHAFAVWTTRTSLWWPRSHTVTEAPGLVVVIEGRPGGRIFERTPEGSEHDWGEVTRWEPPRRLAYRWYLNASPAEATDVEITFTAPGRFDDPGGHRARRVGAPRARRPPAPRRQSLRLERGAAPLPGGLRPLRPFRARSASAACVAPAQMSSNTGAGVWRYPSQRRKRSAGGGGRRPVRSHPDPGPRRTRPTRAAGRCRTPAPRRGRRGCREAGGAPSPRSTRIRSSRATPLRRFTSSRSRPSARRRAATSAPSAQGSGSGTRASALTTPRRAPRSAPPPGPRTAPPTARTPRSWRSALPRSGAARCPGGRRAPAR